VLYGTDLGNGPLPVGLNRREIEALLACGLTPDDVLAALTADFPSRAPAHRAAGPEAAGHRVTVIPGDRPTDARDLAGFTDWLLGARSQPARSVPSPALPTRSLTRPDLEDHHS
jgi:hypothetical protein